jgi:YVTN family beta-propeller protein
MSFRRVGWLAAVALAALLELSCGQVYRPVVIPISIVPPNPANFHAVFGISVNTLFNPGTALQIDVSGDTDIGQATMGVNPTHAAILPNNSRVFVASGGGSLCPGGTDLVTAFFPAGDNPTSTGLGTTTTFTLPNVGTAQSSSVSALSEVGNLVTVTLSAPLSAVATAQVVISGIVISGNTANPSAYNGCFPIVSLSGTTLSYVNPIAGLPAINTGAAIGLAAVPTFCPYLPDYVATSQNNAVYVANYGAENDPNCNLPSTDSVMVLNPVTKAVGNIAYLPAASHPVAMVETPSGSDLYVLNQGNNSVSDLSPSDLSTMATIPLASAPSWAVSRLDSQRVYVVTQGDGELYTINTATNALVPQSPQAVGGPGAGANFVLYDKSRNRLYVTNPTSGKVFVFDATTDPPTPVGSAAGISIPLPPHCSLQTCSTVMPVSVTALPDGSRFYVASYATATSACPDPTLSAAGCVIPQLTVFNAAALTVKSTIFPLLPSVTTTAGASSPYALVPSTFCATVNSYAPTSARFRMSAAAATDGSRVYASLCDGGSVAIVNTTASSTATGQSNGADTLVTDLLAPFSAGTPQSNQEPPPQNPVFLLTGQ